MYFENIGVSVRTVRDIRSGTGKWSDSRRKFGSSENQ